MTIDPETLSQRRKRLNLTQQALAERSGVSKKTISRIERGECGNGRNQSATIDRLARALGTTPEQLAEPPNAISDKERREMLRKAGFRQVKFLLGEDRAVEFGLVARRYRLTAQDIIEMAPLCFTLLAELSLKRRRERLAEIKAAFGRYRELLPPHLPNGRVAAVDYEMAVGDEEGCLSSRDLMGRYMDDEPAYSPYEYGFHWDSADNPFNVFLRGMAQEVDPEQEVFEFEWPDSSTGLPVCNVAPGDFHDLTNGNPRAKFALKKGHVRLSDIPKHLDGADAASDRADWLASHVPDDEWEEHERRLSEIAAIDLSDLIGGPVDTPAGGEASQ